MFKFFRFGVTYDVERSGRLDELTHFAIRYDRYDAINEKQSLSFIYSLFICLGMFNCLLRSVGNDVKKI